MFPSQTSLTDLAGSAMSRRASTLTHAQPSASEALGLAGASARVAVLPYDPDKRVCVAISATGPQDDDDLEAISGTVLDGGPASQARSDTLSLAGIELDVLEPVAKVAMQDRMAETQVLLFLGRVSLSDAEVSRARANSTGRSGAARLISFDRLETLVRRGTLTDAKTLLLIQALMLRHPHLWCHPA